MSEWVSESERGIGIKKEGVEVKGKEREKIENTELSLKLSQYTLMPLALTEITTYKK